MEDCSYRECPYKADIEVLKQASEDNKQRHKEFNDKFNDSQVKIALAEERYSNLVTLMSEVKTSVNELKEKPGKRWDTIVTYVITAIIGILIGSLSAFIG